MSEVKVNKISPRTNCGTTQLGDSGDTFTIPAGVSITNQGTASGFGSTGEVSWVTTKKTATFTATAGEGYFCDTSGGAFTVNLPAGTAGNSFAVADYTNTFQLENLTITPNGSQKIGGVAADAVLSIEGQSAYFVYVDDTEGWKNVIDSTSNVIGATFMTATGGTITTSGNCKIHTFTSPGTFCVSSLSNTPANNEVSYMVVAGGGGGGSDRGGGGGAGGYREVKNPVTPYTASPLDGYSSAPNRVTVTATAFPITVGAGGALGTNPSPVTGGTGNASSFSTITSAGGGGGGGAPNNPQAPGVPGGSGGGASAFSPIPAGPGGTGNTPPVNPPQGNNGGTSTYSPYRPGGGGGGATAAGTNGFCTPDGSGVTGGAGATTNITGSPTVFAGGGGGGASGCCSGGGGGGAGGSGGGGAGGASPGGGQGTAGTANTGGGGGGGGNLPNAAPAAQGGAGGSGIVVIRYKFQ
jgi:hypothetical protein